MREEDRVYLAELIERAIQGDERARNALGARESWEITVTTKFHPVAVVDILDGRPEPRRPTDHEWRLLLERLAYSEIFPRVIRALRTAQPQTMTALSFSTSQT